MDEESSGSGFPNTSPVVGEVDLRARLEFLTRYAWVVFMVVLVAVNAAYWLTARQTPIYETSSTVLLRTNQTAALFPFSSSTRNELYRTPETEQLFADGETYRAVVRPLTPTGVSVQTAISDGRALTFTARSSNPEAAATAADIWAESYVELRHEAVLLENASATDFISATLVELDGERNALRSDVILLEGVLEGVEDPDQYARILSQKVSLETQLQTQLSPIDTQIRDFSTQLADLELVDRYLDDSAVSARVERGASVPTSPVSPNVPRNLITAGLLGLALGSALAYALHALNNQVRTDDDVARATGLPVLTSVPQYKVDGDFPVETVINPGSLASERYRSLVTALEFASVREPISSLLVTSPMAGEGKSTTAVNIAALAAKHMKVLIIGADMRRPSLHKIVDASNERGLSTLLVEDVDFDEIRVPINMGGTTFDLLPAGPLPSDPALLLRSERWQALLAKLVDRYELVVIDGPPVLPVTDALLIGRDSSAQLLVSRTGSTTRSDLTKATELLRSNGSRVLGVVANGEKIRRGGSAYRYEYSSTE